MILKNLTRRSGIKQLLKYLLEKEGRSAPIILKHNLRSRTIDGLTEEFEQNNALRLHKRTNSIAINHTIISFSNLDRKHVNEKVLKDMAAKYVELRGEKSLYLATAHRDKDHIHLHIVMSATELHTGKSNRISRSHFKSVKIALDEYQREKYPELSHSLPEHGKSKKSRLTINERENPRNTRTSQRNALLKLLRESFAAAKSLRQLLSLLERHGHIAYYRAGRLTGIKFNGERKFRFNRLGYAITKLESLGQTTKEAVILADLRALRERHSQQRERSSQLITEDRTQDQEKDTDKEDIER